MYIQVTRPSKDNLCPRSKLRLALVLLVATASHACWVLEQPSGSNDVLPGHDRLDWLFNEVLYVGLS